MRRKPGSNAPHMRGDGPVGVELLLRGEECSPHAWGWTVADVGITAEDHMLPTRVGVDRLGLDADRADDAHGCCMRSDRSDRVAGADEPTAGAEHPVPLPPIKERCLAMRDGAALRLRIAGSLALTDR